jgi:hypothetical protein
LRAKGVRTIRSKTQAFGDRSSSLKRGKSSSPSSKRKEKRQTISDRLDTPLPVAAEINRWTSQRNQGQHRQQARQSRNDGAFFWLRWLRSDAKQSILKIFS